MTGGAYFKLQEVGIEWLPELPEFLGYPGSSRSKEVWKYGVGSGPQVPPYFPPGFTWNPGYPEKFAGCLYVVLDFATAISYGTECCAIDLGELRCGSRRAVGSYKYKYRWRFMVLDCDSRGFTEVTGDAVTPTDPFEGLVDLLDTPLDRDCETKKFTALPDFFEDVLPVVCE